MSKSGVYDASTRSPLRPTPPAQVQLLPWSFHLKRPRRCAQSPEAHKYSLVMRLHRTLLHAPQRGTGAEPPMRSSLLHHRFRRFELFPSSARQSHTGHPLVCRPQDAMTMMPMMMMMTLGVSHGAVTNVLCHGMCATKPQIPAKVSALSLMWMIF